MRICVFGAGAIGSVIAAGLKAAGHDVSIVARGDHLAAIRAQGLCIEANGERTSVDLPASDRAADLGRQDVVISTVKAHALPEAAPSIAALTGPETSVVYALNGMPWWYFHKSGDQFDGRRIALLDPGGDLWNTVGVERAIGCVVNFSSSIVSPGIVRRAGTANRLLVGEPDGGRSERLDALASALTEAGFEIDAETPIRRAVWSKLRRGAISSALATVTSTASGAVIRNDELRPIFRQGIVELTAVASAFGYRLEDDVDTILDEGAKGQHRPSMLQDLDYGRKMEIDAQLTVPQQFARLAGLETPVLDIVFALVRARAQASGLYLPQP